MPAPIPMPIHLAMHHPIMRAMAAPAVHYTMALLTTYWLAECRPLPTASFDLMRLAVTDLRGWHRHKMAVSEAIAILCPVFKDAFEQETTKRRVRIERATKAGRIGTIARWHGKANPAPTPPTPQRPQEGRVMPSRIPGYGGTGKMDEASRKAAFARHDGVQDQEGGGLMRDVTLAQPSELLSPDALRPWTWQPTPTPPPDLTEET